MDMDKEKSHDGVVKTSKETDLAKCPPSTVPSEDDLDLCVPVVFAIDREKFFDINFISLPPKFCPCKCEKVKIIDKAIAFDCDKAVLCVDYCFDLRFGHKHSSSSSKTYQASFKKEIPFKDFFSDDTPITLEEFQKTDSACVNVEFIKCVCLEYPSPCGKLKNIFIFVSFDILVKLLQERNVLISAKLPETTAVVLPRKDSCGSDVCSVDEFIAKLPSDARKQCEEAIEQFCKSGQRKHVPLFTVF